MPDRNQSIRISVIVVLAFALTAFVLPLHASPAVAASPTVSLWNLIDDAWQSVIGAISGGNGDDGEQGPIMDPDGQPLTAPQVDPGADEETAGGPAATGSLVANGV